MYTALPFYSVHNLQQVVRDGATSSICNGTALKDISDFDNVIIKKEVKSPADVQIEKFEIPQWTGTAEQVSQFSRKLQGV